VQGLHASVQDLREAGEVGETADGDSGRSECGVGAAGAVCLYTQLDEAAGELDQALLVGDAEQGAGYSGLRNNVPPKAGLR
jgi:hypothetical protein